MTNKYNRQTVINIVKNGTNRQDGIKILNDECDLSYKRDNELNGMIETLVRLNAGPTDPATMTPSCAYPYMIWPDTTNRLLKQRTSDNTAWVTIGVINANGTFEFYSYGLGTEAKDITGQDLNADRPTGFYRGANLTNAPSADFYFIIQISHSDPNWYSQEIISFGTNSATPNIAYRRVKQNGIWTSWQQVITSSDVVTTATANKILKLDANGNLPTNITGNAATVGGYSPSQLMSASVPTGIICMWSGSASNIPSGWHLCDGTNGTPDLRNRFVLGAGDSYAVGATGGEASHTLTINEIPSHNHSISDTYVSNAYGAPDYYNYNAIYVSNGNYLETRQTGYAGGGQPHNNMPPYYALCYIMKIS